MTRTITILALAAALAAARCDDGAPAPQAGDGATSDAGSNAGLDASAQDTTEAKDTASLPTPDPCPIATSRDDEGFCRPVVKPSAADLLACAWPEELGTVLHVDATADAASADGTEAHPFPTLAAGLGAAAAGTTLLVHPGEYAGGVSVPAGVSVVGRCAAEVTIAGPAAGVVLTVEDADGVRIEGMTLRGGVVGAQLWKSNDVHLRRVRVTEVQRGVDVNGGSVYVESCAIEGITADGPVQTSLTPGYGVAADLDSRVVIAATIVQDTGLSGLSIADAELSLVDGCEVRGGGGVNVQLQTNARGLIEGAIIEDAAPRVLPEDTLADGIVLFGAGAVTVRGNTVEGNQRIGISVDGGGPASIADNDVKAGGEGIRIQNTQKPVAVRDNRLRDNVGGGIVVLGSTAEVRKNEIRDLHADGGFGEGIELVDSEGSEVADNQLIGIAGTGILLSETTATVTGNELDGTGGDCLWAQHDSRVTLTGNTLGSCTRYGIGSVLGSEAIITGNTIRGVQAVGEIADGILVAAGGSARVEDNLLPVPTGIFPNPLRAAIVVDGPGLPTSELLGLPGGLGASISGNTVEEAAYGVVTQALGNGVGVGIDENAFDDVDVPTAEDIGLGVDAKELLTKPALPVPTGI